MKFYSTRDASASALFDIAEAAFKGLAPDGGLFVPERVPQLDIDKVDYLAEKSYADMAAYIAKSIFDDIDSKLIDEVVADAYNFPLPLHSFGDDRYALELFHGPTFAFKDYGARFMGRMVGLLNKGRKLTVLTATSGDTGSAVACGFYGVEGVDVVLLYPDGKVSSLQESQMTTLGGNIHPLKIAGNFDDCQRMVKEMFNDKDLRSQMDVTSANSINLLRWVPQSFYYFYGCWLWKKATGSKDAPEIIVPSGNFGNITAGMLAHKMGLPVKRFIAATNANDVVPQFLMNGLYEPRPSIRTVANAMDVGAPSNYERLMWLYGNNLEAICSEVKGFSCSDAEILCNMKEMYMKYSYSSCPHSAVGYAAAKHFDIQGFWLSTAHPAKFLEVAERAQVPKPSVPAPLAAMMSKEKQFTRMGANGSELRDFLLKSR